MNLLKKCSHFMREVPGRRAGINEGGGSPGQTPWKGFVDGRVKGILAEALQRSDLVEGRLDSAKNQIEN
jgi:hypothetical protein